ncbi:MAG: DUF5330 domain-containing protein [Hyphomicrobium sp.]
MGLMRIAIVVAAGVALLPSDREQQQRLVKRASDAATWTVTFCDRNAATCAQADGLWKQFAAKAEFAAKLAYETMQDASAERVVADRGDVAGARKAAPVGLKGRAGTLTPHDLRPAWRGADKSRGSI